MLQIKQNQKLASFFPGLKLCIDKHNYMTRSGTQSFSNVSFNKADMYKVKSVKHNYIFDGNNFNKHFLNFNAELIMHFMLSDSNVIRTHNDLVRKRTLNHLAKHLVRLQSKWLWVRITLLSLKLQISRLLRARSSLTFRQTIERRFTLKLVRDIQTLYANQVSQGSHIQKVLGYNTLSNHFSF